MKKYTLTLLTAMLFSACMYAQEAIPVMDIQLKNELEGQADDHMQQFVNLFLTHDRVRKAGESVEQTRALQEQYRHFLRQTSSTAPLSWMDSQSELEPLTWVAAADGHLDDYRFAHQLSRLYAAQAEPGPKSQLLYEWLVPFDDTMVFTGLAAFREDQRQRELHRQALRQMQQRRQLQLARWQQIRAASSQQEAQQLAALLLQPYRFSMTEAERLSLLTRLEAGFLQSQQAQLQADALISKSRKYSFSKALFINSYTQQMSRQATAETTLF